MWEKDRGEAKTKRREKKERNRRKCNTETREREGGTKKATMMGKLEIEGD